MALSFINHHQHLTPDSSTANSVDRLKKSLNLPVYRRWKNPTRVLKWLGGRVGWGNHGNCLGSGWTAPLYGRLHPLPALEIQTAHRHCSPVSPYKEAKVAAGCNSHFWMSSDSNQILLHVWGTAGPRYMGLSLEPSTCKTSALSVK